MTKTTLSKSAGAALLLAAGLLLALFALGVFTDPNRASGSSHGLQTLEIYQGNTSTPGLKLTLKHWFNVGTTSYEAIFPKTTTAPITDIFVVARANSSDTTTKVSVTATDADALPSSNDSVGEFEGAFGVKEGLGDLTGSLVQVRVVVAGGDSQVYRVLLRQEKDITNNTTAGEKVRVSLEAPLNVSGATDVTVRLPGFGLPATIDPADVYISDGKNGGNPSDVTVSGEEISFPAGKFNTGDSYVNSASGTVPFRISFSSRAGITNPTKAGSYVLEVDSNHSSNRHTADARRVATVERKITVSPEKAGRGADVTVSGTGFADGSITIFRDLDPVGEFGDDDVVLGQTQVTKGAFTFVTNSIVGAGSREATIQAVDFDGVLASRQKTFTVESSIRITPDQVSPSENLTLELVDWVHDDVTHVRFGGASGPSVDVRSQNADATGDRITVALPRNARLGRLKVEVLEGNTVRAAGSVVVEAHALSISPARAVPGQEITIQGSGFGSSARIDSLTFGGENDVYANTADSVKPTSDSNGNIVLTIDVPLLVSPGARQVKVTMANNRVGTANLTVPGPSLTVTPAESRRGTPLTLSGTGFTVGDSVQIKYDRAQSGVVRPQVITSATVNSSGSFTATFDVPKFARIGHTSRITVSSQLNDENDAYDAVTAEHRTPKPVVTVAPGTSWSGSTITVSGRNFAGYAPVAELLIGDRDVRPVPTPATDAEGSLVMSGILVPQLDPGVYTVKLKIVDQTVTRFLTVTSAPVSAYPADVFQPLAESGLLVVVWHYENSTGDWSSYSPFAPLALNDLGSVSPGMIVWVQVSADTEFQGRPLVKGWSLIVLD